MERIKADHIKNHLVLPSPVHELNVSWAAEYDIEIWMKRDDLIHPVISGNKWRKLSGILDAYSNTDWEILETYGGAYSNHIVACACAAAIAGKKSVGYIRGERTSQLNAVLRLCEFYGMELRFLSRSEFRNTKRTYGVIENSLVIPEGGACDEGIIGCMDILQEVTDPNQFSKLFLACGTGTTLTGIARYITKSKLNIDVVGIQALKGVDYLKGELEEKYEGLVFSMLDTYHFGGYAKTNPDLIGFIEDFGRQTGILLDPIYSGKMMYAVKDQIERGLIESGERILTLHTGGLTGWFGKMNEI